MYENNQLIHTDSMKEIIYNLPLEGGVNANPVSGVNGENY